MINIQYKNRILHAASNVLCKNKKRGFCNVRSYMLYKNHRKIDPVLYEAYKPHAIE